MSRGSGMVVAQDILIDAPVELVWRTVNEPEHIARWFADEVDLRVTPGYAGSLTFTDRLEPDAPAKTVQVSVQSVDPPRSFSYRWEHPRGASARSGNSVLVTFTLTPEGAGTRLRVVETGLDEMPWSTPERDTYRDEHTRGWATLLGRVREQLADQRAR